VTLKIRQSLQIEEIPNRHRSAKGFSRRTESSFQLGPDGSGKVVQEAVVWPASDSGQSHTDPLSTSGMWSGIARTDYAITDLE